MAQYGSSIIRVSVCFPQISNTWSRTRVAKALVRGSRASWGRIMRTSWQRNADVAPQTACGPQGEAASGLCLGGFCLLLSLLAIVLSQGLGPAPMGAHGIQGAAHGQPAEAVRAAAGEGAAAVGAEAQGFPEGFLEAAGHEAVEHRVHS